MRQASEDVTMGRASLLEEVKVSVSEESGGYTASQRAMVELWEEHTAYEFEAHSTEKTLATMVDDPVNINVPLLTGGVGLEEVRKYYSEYFIPKNPPDTEITLLSRTVGEDRVVDELILTFTHTTEMDWMLPGVPPTGRRVEAPTVAIVEFRDGKIASEHIYWDQASVLVQVGLLDGGSLPVTGAESVRKLLDPTSVPSDLLIERARRGRE
jgi:carboxymethylenebutenolidase